MMLPQNFKQNDQIFVFWMFVFYLTFGWISKRLLDCLAYGIFFFLFIPATTQLCQRPDKQQPPLVQSELRVWRVL
jgi:hypothetical protein